MLQQKRDVRSTVAAWPRSSGRMRQVDKGDLTQRLLPSGDGSDSERINKDRSDVRRQGIALKYRAATVIVSAFTSGLAYCGSNSILYLFLVQPPPPPPCHVICDLPATRVYSHSFYARSKTIWDSATVTRSLSATRSLPWLLCQASSAPFIPTSTPALSRFSGKRRSSG